MGAHVRPALLRVLRVLLMLLLMAVLAQGFVCSLVVLQGGRDETRSADAIVVLYPTVSDTAASASALAQAHLEQTLDLYERGLASHVVLVGENTLAMQEVLLGQGMPETALLLEESAGGRYARMQTIANLLYRQGLHSVLLVDEPAYMLLDLKMTRDLGLIAYGSPLSTEPPSAGRVMRAGLDYWQYVLLGSS